MLELNKLYLMDCMIGMREFPDKYFSLAIVDPPYFHGPQKSGYYKGTGQITDIGDYKDLSKSWDIPDEKYFTELLRVSLNQIIWGINYFNVLLTGGRIIWIKGEQGSPFSMADIAYQSFYNRIDLFKYVWSGFWQEKGYKRETRIHPTQKPVQLYKWILHNYAKPDMKIIDTHVGSGSSIIAFLDFGCEWIGFEIDKDYHASATKRIEVHKQQLKLF